MQGSSGSGGPTEGRGLTKTLPRRVPTPVSAGVHEPVAFGLGRAGQHCRRRLRSEHHFARLLYLLDKEGTSDTESS